MEDEDEAASALNAITGRKEEARDKKQEQAAEVRRRKRVQAAREHAAIIAKEKKERERAKWDPMCWKKVSL